MLAMAPVTLTICSLRTAPMGRRSQAAVLVLNSEHRSQLYTTGIMTSRTVYAIVGSRRKGLQVRKGKAMLQMNTNRMNNTDRLFDLQGTMMPTAKGAEWLICGCLYKNGSSGCLEPGACARAGGWPDRIAVINAEIAACPKSQAAFIMFEKQDCSQ